jgi:hypothetical protein
MNQNFKSLKGGFMATKEIFTLGNTVLAQVMATCKGGYQVDYFIHVYQDPQKSEEIVFDLYSQLSALRPLMVTKKLKVKDLKKIKERIEEDLSKISNNIVDSCDVCGVKRLEDLRGFEEMVNLKGNIKNTIDDIKTAGKELAKYLPSPLQPSNGITKDPQNHDEHKWMWIFCEEVEVLDIWEWIYSESSNNNGEEGFFGDTFSIIMVSKDYKFDNEITNFTINKSSTLLLIDGDRYARLQREYFKEIIPVLKEIKLKYDLMRMFKHLLHRKLNRNGFDILHLAVGGIKNKRHYLENITDTVKANFVFLNICECENVSDKFRSEEKFINGLAKNKGITIPWIRTCFKIDGYFAYHFAREFYKVFLNEEKNVAEAVRDAKKKSNDYSKELFGFENVWRLAYAMGGNPFACAIRKNSTSRKGEVLNRKLPHKKT